jgi:glycosyltransferase involved in cell wall biosynthesis
MKIVYIHQYFSQTNRSYRQASAMVRAGHEVHMVTSDRQRSAESVPRYRTEITDGIRVHWIAVPYSNHFSNKERMLAFAKFAAASTSLVRRIKADLVFATSTPLTVAIPAILGSMNPKRPMIFEVRDLWPEIPIQMGALRNPAIRKLMQALEFVTYKRADHIVALSPGMGDSVREKSPSSEITIIPNSSDTELFSVDEQEAKNWLKGQQAIPEGKKFALYAGAIGRANNVVSLVDVATNLDSIDGGDDLVILVVGEGAEKELLREQALRRGVLGTKLVLMDRLPKSEIAFAYNRASVILSTLLPTKILETSSPNKVFDAFAAGKPVLTNYGGWIADLLHSHGAGVSLPGVGGDAIAKKLVEMTSDVALHSSMSRASKSLGQDMFQSSDLADRVNSIVELTAERF